MTWLLGAALWVGVAQASLIDDIAVGYSPRTGDVWVDARLGDINVFARGDRTGFVDEVVVSTGAPRAYIGGLLDRGWAPGDIYYACLLARQLRLPCETVSREYERNPGQGWGAVAQRLGIKPGSAEFHALKNGVGTGNERMRGRGHGGQRGGPPEGRGGPPERGQGNGKGKGKDKG
jgi:hypothetical protein